MAERDSVMSASQLHFAHLDQLVQAYGDGKVNTHLGRAETFRAIFELIETRKQQWNEWMAPESRAYMLQDIDFNERMFELALFAARRLTAMENKVKELEVTVDLCTEGLREPAG